MEISVRQEELEVDGRKYFATYIPTATSGCWYVIHDLFEMWAAVAIDLDGSIVGWRNPPEEKWKKPIEGAVIKAFGILEPL